MEQGGVSEISIQNKVLVFLIGFGKFGTVLYNPTTALSSSIQQLLLANPIEGLNLENNYIITVAIEDCNEALEDIYNRITKLIEDD